MLGTLFLIFTLMIKVNDDPQSDHSIKMIVSQQKNKTIKAKDVDQQTNKLFRKKNLAVNM